MVSLSVFIMNSITVFLSQIPAWILFVQLEYREESLRRDLHRAELAHFLFAFLLLFEQLFLSRDVAAVALGENVLAHGAAPFRAR